MVQIRWSQLAVEDLKSISDYISRDSKRYALIQVQRLKLRTVSLKTNPRIGRIVPELQKENIRELIEGNYRIIYKILNGKQIDILTIHHSSQNLKKGNIK